MAVQDERLKTGEVASRGGIWNTRVVWGNGSAGVVGRRGRGCS